MEFSQTLPCAGDSAENDVVFVKQELEYDGNIITFDNPDAFTNEECMEFTEEKPIIPEIIENSTNVGINQKNSEDFSSAGTHDFVFVACADNVDLNEMKEDQNLNTNLCDSGATVKTQCPYCKKKYPLWVLDTHKTICEWKYVYPCALCPVILCHKTSVRRHIELKHSDQLNDARVDEIVKDIEAKRVELNIETASDKIKMVSELMTNASLRAEINIRPVATVSSLQFIVPDVVEIQETSREERTPLFVTKAGSNSVVDSSVRRQSNVPLLIIRPTVHKQNQSVANELATLNLEYVHCNECAYRTRSKVDLSSHIFMKHSVELNLISFECPRCQKSFTGLDPMTTHKANCKIKTFYTCLFCPKILLVKANIFSHMRDRHFEKIANKNPIEIAALVEAKKKIIDLAKVNQGDQLKHRVICRAKQRNLNDSSDNDVIVIDSDEQQEANVSSVMTVTNPKTKMVVIQNGSVVAEKEQDKQNIKFCNECHNCTKKFTCQDDLMTHEAACSIRAYFSCPFCKKIFLRKFNVVKHLSQGHTKEFKNREKDEIERLIEAGKKFVDKSIIESRKQRTKIINVEKKGIEIIDIEKESTNVIDTQEDKMKITDTNKKNTQIIDTQNKTTKSKIQYFSCDHCRYGTCRKDKFEAHIMRKHSVELNLTPNRNDRFNYKCPFCSNAPYASMDNVKRHISQKHTSELSNRTIDEVAQEILSNRAKLLDSLQSSLVDPDKIDASTLDYVLVYCDQCKNLKTTPGTLKSHKNNCRDCGARIIYVCSKCKNSHALDYVDFRQHWSRCTEMNDISQDYLDKLVVHKCSQCQFCTTHKYKLAMHVARSKHKAADGASIEADKNEVYDEDQFAVRPCVVDFATMTNRYCPKCDKVITEKMQPRTTNAEGLNCQACKTRFHAQCVKCNIRRSTSLNMRYHLNTKCFPGDYLCIKCTKRTPSWHLMQKHYVIHHTNRRVPYLCEFCSFRSTHRTNFNFHLKKMHPDKTEHIVFTRQYFTPQKDIDYACDLCSFASKHKYSLKVHLHTVHSTKRHKCKHCKFKTRYEANLKRHMTTKHKNHY